MDVELRVTSCPAPAGERRLAVSGQADMDTAGRLEEALDEAPGSAPRPTALVVDCSALTFCTSAGLNALLRARLAASAVGTAFRLTGPTPQMVRLLRLTEADTVFEIDPAGEPPLKESR
ncbi:STAS domain-containing protein [Kitasatospora sp. DSM 101779]|uniref:STAS domain-containing protein n=1 Tax=Kitasatospora sp. DSM 101779 TaxID=2853165 RepID=UPI0021D86BDC|nr:STAS domain-containing protein [Kitasatospora sp. DSM 101779]MCU7826829.1 STAS domain-containing protein [Kitasatospora sp. DSM 101779]